MMKKRVKFIDIVEDNGDNDYDNNKGGILVEDKDASDDDQYLEPDNHSDVNRDEEPDHDLSEEEIEDGDIGAPEIMGVDDIVNDNSDISMDQEEVDDATNINEDHIIENDIEAGAPIIGDNGVNNTMDNAVPKFALRRSLKHAQNEKYTYRNRFGREFQYIQKSVENIRSEAKIKKYILT